MEQGRQVGKVMGAAPQGKGLGLVVPNQKLKLMDQVREVLRVRHYAIRTEQSYCDWIRRYIRFHQMRSRDQLVPGTGKVELFLSDLAVNGHVAASTQNQAFNARLFLYREVLHQLWSLSQVTYSAHRGPDADSVAPTSESAVSQVSRSFGTISRTRGRKPTARYLSPGTSISRSAPG